MAMTGYYRTMQRPRAHQPLSMLKYDPVGMWALRADDNSLEVRSRGCVLGRREEEAREREEKVYRWCRIGANN
jgi:hypothetical protein